MKSAKLVHLYGLMSLEGTLLGAELVASQLTHSLILLTDAYHTFYNIISVILLVISFKMSNEQTVKNTFGWARIEVLGMLTNMTFVVALTFSLVVEGIQQVVHSSHEISEPTNYYLLFIFGICGLVSNLLYFNIVSDAITNRNMLRTHSSQLQEKKVNYEMKSLDIDSPSCSEVQKDLPVVNEKLLTIQCDKEISVDTKLVDNNKNNKSQNLLYGIIRDLSSSILLLVCGLVVMNTEGTVAILSDPIFGTIAAVLFCVTFYPNMKNTGLILLQTVPENMNVGRLKNDILKEFPMILNIHDIHIWGLTASRIIATCHIILPKQSSKSYEQFSRLLHEFFQKEGISLATVQPEFHQTETQINSLSCLMKCSTISKINCDSLSCCNNDNNEQNVKHIDDTQHFEEVIITENS